jgi:hypothetical protein
MRLRAAAVPALVLLAAACSHSPSPQTSASPAPGVSATPAAVAPAPPAAFEPSAYHYVVTPSPPPAGQPAIVEIDMLDQTIHAGAPYSVRVKTSPDVTAISVSSMGTTYGMQAAGPGLFASDGKVPDGIPFFLLNRSYGVTVTAQTADGRSTAVTLSLRLER